MFFLFLKSPQGFFRFFYWSHNYIYYIAKDIHTISPLKSPQGNFVPGCNFVFFSDFFDDFSLIFFVGIPKWLGTNKHGDRQELKHHES